VAQLLAIHFPAKVNKLILVNTFAHLWPTSLHEAYTLARRVVVSKYLPPRQRRKWWRATCSRSPSRQRCVTKW